MDPWMIAALIAAAIGIGTLTSSAAAQATAALPKVTSFSVITVPVQGLSGLWDLWVTGLNGLQGNAMMNLIPGGVQDPSRIYLNMIYIPAALVSAQPTNLDWKYTFVPKGQTAPFTILVPASILQQYAATPKNPLLARMGQSQAWLHEHPLQMTLSDQSGACAPQVVTQAIDDANALIAKFPNNPSASDVASWLASNAASITSVVQEIVTAIQCAANPGDQSTLDSLKSQIESFAFKAGAKAVADALGNAFKSSTDSPSTDSAPTDTTPTDTSSTDAPSTDVPTDSTS